MTEILKAPFPWFGGKSRVAPQVWERFGADVPNYVEPFFGSGAVLLGRPGGASGIETVNDLDGYVCNAWRSIAHSPEEVAKWADWPVNECDLHARHTWLRQYREELSRRLESDPDWHDPKIAGWWLWGMACWIGSGFCGDLGAGPWQVVEGQLINTGEARSGTKRQLPHLVGGRGVTRKLPHLGNSGRGVTRQLPHLGDAGQGVTRKRPHLGNSGQGAARQGDLYDYMAAISERMRRVRVCCGDWKRVCGPAPTFKQGMTGVFLDPPYSAEADRDMGCYVEDCGEVAHDVREWCVENGQNPLLRIALCGYEGEGHEPLEASGWSVLAWKAYGGFSAQRKNGTNENKHRERIWFSPACLEPEAVHQTGVLELTTA